MKFWRFPLFEISNFRPLFDRFLEDSLVSVSVELCLHVVVAKILLIDKICISLRLVVSIMRSRSSIDFRMWRWYQESRSIV